MKILNNLQNEELVETLLAEVAKARNELRCAEADVKKANGRLSFLITVANELLLRYKGK